MKNTDKIKNIRIQGGSVKDESFTRNFVPAAQSLQAIERAWSLNDKYEPIGRRVLQSSIHRRPAI